MNCQQSSMDTDRGKRNQGQAGQGQGPGQRQQSAKSALPLLTRTEQVSMVLKQGEPDVNIIPHHDKQGELDKH